MTRQDQWITIPGEARDLRMLQSPYFWPRWPFLPMKGGPAGLIDPYDSAVVFDTGDGSLKVWHRPDASQGSPSLIFLVRAAKYEEWQPTTPAALIAAGWKVD